MGCLKLTYDFEPTLFLEGDGEKNHSTDLEVWINPDSEIFGVGEVVQTGNGPGDGKNAFTDFLYEVNKWNPVANVYNAISTYLTGYDSYGVKQSNTEASIQLASAIPIFKVGKVGQATFNIGKTAFSYLDDLALKTDLFHNFPLSFDKHIIQNGAWSQRIKDGANWYELAGQINGTKGMFQIGVNEAGLIFHRNFVPF